MRTPVRHGGLGLRSMEDMRLTGFMGGLEQASTSFVGEEPLVPQLAGILGTVEGMQKWRDLLRSASISRTFLGLKLGQISSHFTLQFCGIMFKHYKHNCQVQAFLRRL